MLMTRSHRSKLRFNPNVSFNRGLIAQTGFIPEGAQLLQDSHPLILIDSKKVLSEGLNGKKRSVTRITGLFQEAETQNANGRVYTRPVLSEAVQAIQEDLSARAVWAEFDHPMDAKIHLDRISHLITKLWMDGNKVYGEAEVMEDLPFGAQLKVLLENGRVGISSRGIGDMEVRERNGEETMYVCSGYRIITADAVAEPSVGNAILRLCEGKLIQLKKRTKNTNLFASKIASENILAESIAEYLKNL